MSKEPLYLIDAYGLIYRSYFAFLSHPLRNSAGKNVSALFGFARTLVSLLNSGAPAAGPQGNVLPQPRKPLRLAAVFDSRTPTFRHKMYSEYKANRQKTPDDLHEQVPLVEEVLSALNIPSLRVDGYEADDIIATLALKCQGEGRQCYILSSDKDLLQLVGNGTWELRPLKGKAEGGEAGLPYELVGPKEVKAEWGVSPDKVLDLLSLTGDSSDNVPGVKGVGEKTAVKLMTRYGSLDGIYKNIAGIEGAIGKKIAEGRESAYFSKSLIKLDTSVPLPIHDIDDLSIEKIDRSAGARTLLREGIRQSAKELDPGAGSAKGETGAFSSGGSAPERTAPPPASGPEEHGERKEFETGLALAADPSLFGEGVYKAVLDIGELEALLARAKQQKLLALDFETDSLDAWNAKPIGISFALKPKEAFYVPVAPHRGTAPGGEMPAKDGTPARDESPAPFLDPEKIKSILLPFFSDPSMTIVAHNAKYDYKVSRGWGIPRWQCKIWDTMVAAWLIDPERSSYSLDSLAAYFFGLSPITYNSIVPKGSTFDTVPLETACSYACEDADFCLRVKQHLEGNLDPASQSASGEAGTLFRNLEMPLLPVLAEMEGEGIKIESRVLQEFGVELGKELEGIQEKTYKIVGHEFNLSSTQQLQKVLFEERGLKPGKKTKTGYSTDVAVLEELAREDEVPALILRHRSLSKLKSTYVDALAGLADKEGRVHTNFVQTGTATGRLSSREPNLQNIPIRDEEGRRIREAFIARPGWALVSADYSQIELVILAHLSEDKNLIEAFTEGKDVHARTAALIFGIDENDEKNIPAEQRRIAKTINFGVMYGMSSFRLANELRISRTEAAAFIEAYFRTYAGVRNYIDGLIRKTEETGYASTILGRRRYIPAINSRNKTEKAAAERVAVNTPIQGSAADIVKTAMLRLDSALAAASSPARLLLQVHDELILECPEDAARETCDLVKREMENAVKLKVPLRVNVETGKRWGDFH
ncbi:MAG: DNA polymerase I [Treponema sp.]|nr:DNA polymerase I [Treponema sp.]